MLAKFRLSALDGMLYLNEVGFWVGGGEMKKMEGIFGP